MAIKRALTKTYRWEYFWLLLMVAATLAMHFAIIANPNQLIFDEQHYVGDAKNIIEKHETLRLEHPPLGKLFIVAGIKLFGDNPWGWRFFSVIFGTASIILFYLLCRRLGMSRTNASIATFLLAFENMTFVQNSLAMLDVYFLTFMLAAFVLYTYGRYISSGVAVGLGALAKLNGALAFPAIGIHWLFTRQKRSQWFLFTLLVAPLAFVELMIPLDFAIVQNWSKLVDPIHRIVTMLSMSSSLTFAHTVHESLSRPWEWLLAYKPLAYYITPHYTCAISFSTWALAMPTFAYMVYRAVRRDEAGLFGAAWFFSTYLIWIPASIITDRVSYLYYFYPTVGSICLGMALGLGQLLDIFHKRPRGKLKWTVLSVVIFILLVHLASFVILAPVSPVPYEPLLKLIPWL
jgi:predicted membrane-bound dolichyl-phosphate-mannose-protein mannosyltransferase